MNVRPPAAGSLRTVRLLGRGGMGEVWLCRDDALGVDRAVKFLLPERAGDAALRARFAAEARTLAALGDVPGVVRVHAAGEDPATRRPFIVMDAHLLSPERVRTICTRRLGLPPAAAEAVSRAVFKTHAEFAESAEFSGRARAPRAPNLEPANAAEGGFERARSALGTPAEPAPFSLQSALGDEAAGTARQLPERAVLSIAREIAAALARLHGLATPVVHRDLKPANLLFAADGRLLLADFGIAKVLDPARTGLTRTGMQPGTQRYAAPELLRGDPATPAVDWYSLGVVLFRALTSSFPQWGESFPTREGLRPFSPRWEPLLRDLLAPDPARRLADHAAFSRRLDALERSLDRPRGDRRRAKAAAAALAAAILAAGSLLVFRAASRPDETRIPPPGAKPEIRIPNPVEPHAESAEPHVSGGGSGEAEPPPVAARPFAESDPVRRAKEFAQNAAESVDRALGLGPSAPDRGKTPAAGRPWPPDPSRESDIRVTPVGDIVAAAVADDDLREFRESMERRLRHLLPIENPLDQGGLPPGYDEGRKAQAARYGERIKAAYRQDLAELRERMRAGEKLTRADVEGIGMVYEEWEAWLARKRLEAAAARENRKIPPASPEPGTEESEP